MTIQTDDFDMTNLPPSRRMLSAAPASPKEEAIERALRPKLLLRLASPQNGSKSMENVYKLASHHFGALP